MPWISLWVVVTGVHTIVKIADFSLGSLLHFNYTSVKHIYVTKRERLKRACEKIRFLVHTAYPPPAPNSCKSEFTLCAGERAGLAGKLL